MTKEADLVAFGQQYYDRNWMGGTAGNLSFRLKEKPLEFMVTPSGVNKGRMTTKDLILVQDGKPTKKHPRGLIPSAETDIHREIYRALPGCQSVQHVHPIYSAVISGMYGDAKKPTRFKVEWIEILKAVGINEGEIAEILIVPNWQDVSLIGKVVRQYIETNTAKVIPAFLIYNHGLTAWGHTMDATRNHLEVMEYVCQYLYLRHLGKNERILS